MPYSYLFGNYYYQADIEKMIETIRESRKQQRLDGKTMKTSFGEDFKNMMMGIETIPDLEPCEKECCEKECEK